jgi:hypothetical protein
MISDGQRTLVTKFYEEPRYWESVLVIRVRNPYKRFALGILVSDGH